MAENNTEMSTGRKVLIGVIAVLLLLTVAAYGFGVYYFTRHFLPGSLVNGFNCSYMDETEAEELLTRRRPPMCLRYRQEAMDRKVFRLMRSPFPIRLMAVSGI